MRRGKRRGGTIGKALRKDDVRSQGGGYLNDCVMRDTRTASCHSYSGFVTIFVEETRKQSISRMTFIGDDPPHLAIDHHIRHGGHNNTLRC